MALTGPDTRLRMIAIKQQSGIPLNDKEVKRLAQRQSVEAMYARNGWLGQNNMQGAYNDASGHYQARSRANTIGGIQGQYGDNNVGSVQGINMDRLQIARDNDLLGLQMNNDRSSMVHSDAVHYDQERQRRWERENAGLEARQLQNERMRFDNTKKQADRKLADGIKSRTMDILAKEQAEKKAYEQTPLYLRDPSLANTDYVEKAKQDAIAVGDEAGYLAARTIADNRLKRTLDTQSARDKSNLNEARIKNWTESNAIKRYSAETKANSRKFENMTSGEVETGIRDYLSRINKAKQEGNSALAEALTQAMNRKYGRIQSKKTSGSIIGGVSGTLNQDEGGSMKDKELWY